ncbi:gametocyte-specific factor 1-like [Photinus pyralis]|uniref:CHHC U11-48K-type domain-containing protein n=1 Tax=Photinus pyralis TaxID=7054 RepID=A0A1Y1MAZ4_PHOPY|nr:gametocyte-specific factor 1-like [Photinus pyralis]
MSDDIRDTVLQCPFNPSHVIWKSRLQRHIIKCSQNYPNHFVCHFNALHRFLTREEQVTHTFICPDMKFTQPWRYGSPDEGRSVISTPIFTPNAKAFNMEIENWSAEYE